MRKRMITIPSIPSRIADVESFLQQAIQKINITPERYPDILISLTEAVNNAIVHGNKEDSKKLVKIKMKKIKKVIILTVSDEGGGFNINTIPDPTSPENLECCGGRGVFIMSRLADRISFQNNGSTVEMCFNMR